MSNGILFPIIAGIKMFLWFHRNCFSFIVLIKDQNYLPHLHPAKQQVINEQGVMKDIRMIIFVPNMSVLTKMNTNSYFQSGKVHKNNVFFPVVSA